MRRKTLDSPESIRWCKRRFPDVPQSMDRMVTARVGYEAGRRAAKGPTVEDVEKAIWDIYVHQPGWARFNKPLVTAIRALFGKGEAGRRAAKGPRISVRKGLELRIERGDCMDAGPQWLCRVLKPNSDTVVQSGEGCTMNEAIRNCFGKGKP